MKNGQIYIQNSRSMDICMTELPHFSFSKDKTSWQNASLSRIMMMNFQPNPHPQTHTPLTNAPHLHFSHPPISIAVAPSPLYHHLCYLKYTSSFYLYWHCSYHTSDSSKRSIHNSSIASKPGLNLLVNTVWKSSWSFFCCLLKFFYNCGKRGIIAFRIMTT